MKKTKKINSSALGYAVAFMLLIGLVTSSLLFVVSSHKRLETTFEIRNHLVLDNLFALRYASKYIDTGIVSYYHPTGDTSRILVRNWGSYKVISVETRNKSQLIQKSVFTGFLPDANSPALFLVDQNNSLKINGKITFEGNVFLPERGMENGYIFNEKQEITGNYTQKKSSSFLPKINEKTLFDLDQIRHADKFNEITKDTLVSFFSKTHLYSSINPIYITNRLEGNIVVHSFDSIVVSEKATLDGVILVAPIVHIEKGFKGNVQVFANNRIICEENTHLLYPSSLVLHYTENTIDWGKIVVKKGSKILGGILLYRDEILDNRIELIVEESSICAGLIYNQGTTELKGYSFGSLYTTNFRLNTGGGQHTNHLRNTLLSRRQLPTKFAVPDWLESVSSNKSELIKWY